MEPKKVIEVVGGIICRDGKYLLGKRPLGKSQGGLWEFVGGKIEPGETPEQALARECVEEIALPIVNVRYRIDVTHSYPDRTVHLILLDCEPAPNAEPVALEHAALGWYAPSEMSSLEFCPADVELLPVLFDAVATPIGFTRKMAMSDCAKEFVFFWKGPEKASEAVSKKCLCQWAPYGFEIDGVVYHCAEQYMMAEKARLFNDGSAEKRIMSTIDPAKMKHYGRTVKEFRAEEWDRVKYDVVVRGNLAKFTQNEELKAYLLGTGDAVLVEASPYDSIWGIGMSSRDPDVFEQARWKGENLLGKALMQVRLEVGKTTEVEALKEKFSQAWHRARRDVTSKDMLAWIEGQKARKAAKATGVKNGKGKAQTRDAVDMTIPSPVTDKKWYQEKLIPALQPHVEKSQESGLDCSYTQDQIRIQAEFDRLYRPFAYRTLLLERKKGGMFCFSSRTENYGGVKVLIPFRGDVRGDELWSEVRTKLFQTKLAHFNFNEDRVGQGAFRSFIKHVMYTTWQDMLRKESEVLRDVHGKVIYQQDENGRYKLDKSGKKKPVRIPKLGRATDEDDKKLEGVGYLSRPTFVRNRFSRTMMINIAYIAYMTIHEKNKTGWFYEAAADFFERGMSREDVIKKYLEQGTIKNRVNFDTALCRFREAWAKERKALQELIVSSVDEQMRVEEEWNKLAMKFGRSKVLDVRHYVIKGLL